MLGEVLLAAVVSAALFGAALLWVSHTERRRAGFRARLNAITTAPARDADVPTVSLRKLSSRRNRLPTRLAAKLESACAAAGNRIAPLPLLGIAIIAGAATGFLALAADFGAPLATAVGATATIVAPITLLNVAQSRYQRKFLDAFPDALDIIVRAVRAGLPAVEAMEVVTRESGPPVDAEFRRMLAEMRIGTELEEALEQAAGRVRISDFRFFVVSLVLQRQTGGGIADTLANLSSIIRQRKALRQKARAMTAEAQASAAVMAATPFVAGGALFLINRDLMSSLFLDPRGRFMLGVAVICLISGIVTMKALIRKSLG